MLLSAINASLSSQNISIELSTKWVKGFDIFQKDSTICYPELIITYRNNSDTNYYFQKISNSRCGLPMLPCGTLLQYPIDEYLNPNYLKRTKTHGNYANEYYNVIIGRDMSFNKGWICMNDTTNIELEEEIEMINCDLADIYEYLYRENVSELLNNSESAKFYFSIADLTPAKILNEFREKFVFLMSGETYINTYNICGFQLVKGNFTFYIDPSSLKNYVNTTPVWDKNQLKYIEVKTALPKEVGEYKLYSGKFNSNKISIIF